MAHPDAPPHEPPPPESSGIAASESGDARQGAAPDVVVGWVQAGPLSKVQRRAVVRARTLVRRRLADELPAFAWESPLVRRADLTAGDRLAEPVELLDAGAAEKEIAGWDFALVVTAVDLRARSRPFALAAPSNALDCGALSLARLDPGLRTELDDDTRADVMARRLAALALHTFGHLNGLRHSADPAGLMHPPGRPADLDSMELFSGAERAELAEEVADVADPRMEETGLVHELTDAAFAVKATLLGLDDVLDGLLTIKPWRFPFQLAKLSTAAVSTLVVLVITAEAWDLGTRQPPWLVALLSVGTLAATSVYLVGRQHLLNHRHGRRRTEQRVVSNVTILLALAIGMATTYAALYVTTLALAFVLFDAPIRDAWAGSLGTPVGLGHILTFAGFVAAFGLAVGALGASFEDETYFRHVAYVDEET